MREADNAFIERPFGVHLASIWHMATTLATAPREHSAFGGEEIWETNFSESSLELYALGEQASN